MENTEKRVTKAKKFLQECYYDKLTEAVRLGNNYLIIDFKKLIEFDPEMGEELIDDFEDYMQCFVLAAESFECFESNEMKNFNIRFSNVSQTEHVPIWKLRAKNVNKLIITKGYIRKISDVLHGVSSSKFECPQCGNIINILQLSETFKEPTICGCGRRGKFKLLNNDIFDLQKLVIEEDPIELGPGQKPRRILALIKNDLCRDDIDKSLQPSTKIQITGLLKDKPVKKESTIFSKLIEVNYLQNLNESYESVKFSKKEIEEYKNISQSPTLFEDMAQSVVPNIYGHDIVKQAIFLQLMGGNHLYNNGTLEERGTIHILLIGSPGSGKSQILKRAIQFIPNSRFTGGRGASGIGLVAAVVKDEEMGGAVLDAGAVPMCNKSMCAIDELDKMDKNDIAMMNNAMNDLRVNIDKWNVHGTLETDTMILGAANPKNRVFDKRELIWKQIGLPKDHLDRYDLVFPVETMSSEGEQKKVAGIIFSKYRQSVDTQPIYKKELVVKYISYARQNISPVISPEAEEYITKNFINLVKPSSDEEDQAYFSSRLLTNIIRLATASAKARLSKNVEIDDAVRGIKILVDSLVKQNIIINHSGKLTLDIEKLEGIIPKPKRDKMKIIVDIIKNLEKDCNGGSVDFMDIANKAKEIKIDESDLDDYLEKLKQSGELYEPRVSKYKTQ